MEWNVSELLSQFQQQIHQFQEQLRHLTATGEAGGGLVKATMNGAFQLVNLEIDPSLLTEQQKTVIEDLVVAAVNIAQQNIAHKIQEVSQEQFGIFGNLASFLSQDR